MSSEEKILDMVREQLRRTHPPSTEALYGRAARIDDSIRELTLRQFNARYPLRVRREMAREEDEKEGSAARAWEAVPEQDEPDEADRPALRQLFHELAAEVAEARAGPDLIDLVGERMELYVDQAMAALADD